MTGGCSGDGASGDGSPVAGGVSVVGGVSSAGGVSVAGGGVGSLAAGGGVEGGASSGADGCVSPLVPAGDGVLVGPDVESLASCEGPPDEDGAAFGAVEGAAGEGDGEPAPVVRSDTPSRAFASSRRGSPEVAAVRPSRTVRTVFRTVSLPPSSSVDTCSSTRSTTPGRMRSTSSVGVGLSESGASEVRSETTTTAAATTPTPADAYPRPVRPRRESPRRERKFGRGGAGAFAPRPSLRIRLRTSFVTAGPPSS